MEQWYTLHTRPNAEYQVAEVLQQRQLQVYLPHVEVTGNRRRREHRPFFPCYMFVRVDLEAVGLSLIRWTPGLRRVVAFGDRPAAVPDSLIDLIRQQLEASHAGGHYCRFQPGDPVRIVDGPFRDMIAVFDRALGASERVQVLLKVLGQVSRMQIEASCLEKAPAGAGPQPEERPRRTTRGRGRPIRLRP